MEIETHDVMRYNFVHVDGTAFTADKTHELEFMSPYEDDYISDAFDDIYYRVTGFENTGPIEQNSDIEKTGIKHHISYDSLPTLDQEGEKMTEDIFQTLTSVRQQLNNCLKNW
eukprot:TRINITY_DN3531_c0_g1_i1.p1 TRINITY_DN3531_c0_g1~~TRINITY_DN3531_c0_g1_i1.p1  ORF type:complete len:113 (-),score=15.98 TRINITY_DN3531_c0_g1_i1:278-616(-)